jgi:hypothetical protein
MRHPTILALGLALLSWSAAADARTPGPECRSACAPRIAEQCGDRTGRELRRCRRPLLRACRATTPGIGCPSSSDLTRALGDRQLQLSSDTTLRLCADGRFLLHGPVSSGVFAPSPAPVDQFGSWSVVPDDAGLAIDLSANVPLPRRRAIGVARDANGQFVVDGAPAADTDASTDCALPPQPPVGPTPPSTPVLPSDPADPERVLAVTRAITDRTLTVAFVDASGTGVHERLTLCSSGAVRVVTLSAGAANDDRGTWAVDAQGASIELTLDAGIVPATVGVTALDDRPIFLADALATVTDARDACRDIDLETRFSALLPGNAYVTRSTIGAVEVSTTLAFCSADRFAIRSDFGLPIRGSYFVGAEDGTAAAVLRLSGITRVAMLSLAPNGDVLVDGTAPTTNPLALRAACE